MDKKIMDAAATPGRPAVSESKRIQMRLEIAKIARNLFQDEGYGRISMRRIAKEMGCSPMTLYKYYDAKVDILRTLWADVFNDLFDHLEAVPEESPSGTRESRLEHLGTAYVRYWLDHPDYYRLVFISDGVTQSDVSVFIDSPELIPRFMLFAEALSASCSNEEGSEALQVRLDAFLCFLNGIAHNLITISGYNWSDPGKMVAMAVSAVTD